MTTTFASLRAGTTAPAPLRRPRTSVWPYAGLLSGTTAGLSTMMLSMGRDTFDPDTIPTARFIVDHLNSELTMRIGGGLALVSVVSMIAFLVGLVRFAERLAPARESLLSVLRWASIALVGTAFIGVAMHYVAASSHPGSIDQNLYTTDATATVAVLADQLTCAVFLPGLVVMAVVAVLSLRNRVFARPVGAVVLVLAAASTVATLAIGLPYSAGLVFPLFALLIGAAGALSRKAV
jgi:hypothetical protein